MNIEKISKMNRPEPLSGKHKGTFAYITICDRLPEILTKVIDSFSRLASEYHKQLKDEKADDCKKIVSKLSKLKNEMQTDKSLLMLKDDYEDVEIWNSFIKNIPVLEEEDGCSPSWFNVAWLYCECYFYRKIFESLRLSKYHHDFDPFFEQKSKSFFSSLEMFKTLANCTVNILQSAECSEAKLRTDFELLIEYCLWGNKCDLSISAGVDVVFRAGESNEFQALLDHIVSNDTEQIWQHIVALKNNSATQRRIDFVLDNAGFELITDLCLAEFLLDSSFCDVIYFHVKNIPWFISDTRKSDFLWTVDQCNKFDDDKFVKNLGGRWQERLSNGSFKIVESSYWTLPNDFADMSEADNELYNCLSKSSLVVFKGDLNYRKLIGDRNWEHTTAFSDALCGFSPASLCALRTLKSDSLVGLERGKSEETELKDKDWLTTAKYGVIQFFKKI